MDSARFPLRLRRSSVLVGSLLGTVMFSAIVVGRPGLTNANAASMRSTTATTQAKPASPASPASATSATGAKKSSTTAKKSASATKKSTKAAAPVNFNVSKPYDAPEFTELQNWVNSKPLTLADLRGQVVLLNFWTFGCFNCQNTIPHIRDLYAKYHGQGFEIVGLHAPEFDYEKEAANVAKAVKKDRITWPVAQDNGFKTWRRYKNGFWPSFYYLDRTGKVRYTHIGEGGYAEQDAVVAALLAEPVPPTV